MREDTESRKADSPKKIHLDILRIGCDAKQKVNLNQYPYEA